VRVSIVVHRCTREQVLEVEPVAGKDKLKQLKVDVGAGSDALQIVTNAPNVVEGCNCIVATVGSTVTMNGEEIEVKEASVGGVKSAGMLCDAPMLGWSGGGAGNAALVPDSFAPGDSAPDKRPRMDGGISDDSKKKGQVEVVLSSKDKRKADAAAKKVILVFSTCVTVYVYFNSCLYNCFSVWEDVI